MYRQGRRLFHRHRHKKMHLWIPLSPGYPGHAAVSEDHILMHELASTSGHAAAVSEDHIVMHELVSTSGHAAAVSEDHIVMHEPVSTSSHAAEFQRIT